MDESELLRLEAHVDYGTLVGYCVRIDLVRPSGAELAEVLLTVDEAQQFIDLVADTARRARDLQGQLPR